MVQLLSHKEIKERIIELANKVKSNALKDDKERKKYHDLAQKILIGLEDKGETESRLYQFNKEKASMKSWDLRSYFSFQIINQLLEFDFNSTKTNEFISLFLPKPLNKRQSSYCSYLISLAMSFRHKKLLDCLAHYMIECDSISFPSQPLVTEIVRDSPIFCATIISRGYFLQHQTGKDNLTMWLQTLIDLLPKELMIGLNHAIRYSFNEKPDDYELHLAILNVIKYKKCQSLNNHFLIDMATTISARKENQSLKDRFAHILIIAFGNQLCSQSNQLKSILKDKFSEQDILFKAFSEL